MNKKAIILCTSLVTALTFAVTAIFIKGRPLAVKGQTETFSFTLNADNAPATYGEGVDVVATGLGNAMEFNYVGASASSGNHMALAAGGYIQNVDKIKDLTSITVTGNGSFKLHTGFEGYTNVKSFNLSGGSEVTELANVSYFKLEAVTASTVESIAGELSCSDTQPAAWTRGNGAVYDTANWNRLIHDVDTSKDFTYTFSFSSVSSDASRTSRPTFFIYPAAYEADDSITCTNDGNVFNGGGYYHIRQDSYQVCHASGSSAESKICKEGSWIDNTITGKSTSQEGYFGGSTETQARTTRNATMEVTFKLENKYKEDSTRYQVWTTTLVCDSIAYINNTDYTGHYVQNYVLTSESGNIFPCDSIGISVALNNTWTGGTFEMLSASSTGVR